MIYYAANHYPNKHRRIKLTDPDTGQQLVCLTSHFTLSALTIAQLYRKSNCTSNELYFK